METASAIARCASHSRFTPGIAIPLRRAMRLTHTFWGGRFNPIVFADRVEEARDLIELFRVDYIACLGNAPEVGTFRDSFPHLINPFFPDELFLDRSSGSAQAHVLDVQNALAYWREKPGWATAKENGFRRISWDEDDPLADAFLMQYGAYPDAPETGIDYAAIFSQVTGAVDLTIDKSAAIPEETLKHPAIACLARHAIERHHVVHAGWSFPGFFIGDASSMDDLVACWNLRAADISLCFIDLSHGDRYTQVFPFLKAS